MDEWVIWNHMHLEKRCEFSFHADFKGLPDISFPAIPLSADDLWAHPVRCTCHWLNARSGQADGLEPSTRSKVTQLHITRRVPKDIGTYMNERMGKNIHHGGKEYVRLVIKSKNIKINGSMLKSRKCNDNSTVSFTYGKMTVNWPLPMFIFKEVWIFC